MKSSTQKYFEELTTRLKKPCSGCNTMLKLKDIRLDGFGDMVEPDVKVLFFTHKECHSTMVAKHLEGIWK